MKFTAVVALAAVSSAFVVPSDEVFTQLTIEEHRENWYDEVVSAKDGIFSSFKKHFGDVKDSSRDLWSTVTETTTNAIDAAFAKADKAAKSATQRVHDAAFDAEAWLETEVEELDFDHDDEHRPPPRGPHPPHRRPPHKKRPHHPPHHHKPNMTVYELIASSKYTTKLAFLINQYPDLIQTLNGTKANYTVFAPTDKAFEKVPKHAKPSKEQIEKLLTYHISPVFAPAGRVLVTHTLPTLLKSDSLGSEPLPQRLRLHVGLNGLTVNFYSHIVAINIFGTNGVIHGIDSLLLPPPPVAKIIDLLPGQFSTLELGLAKTGLFDKLNTTKHAGGTLFAPSNSAFERLGPRVNAFLFSEHGLKYLKALLSYHVVPNNTLYSDAFYSADAESESIPRGRFHVDLPTLLEGRNLSIDVLRWAGYINIRINGFTSVAIEDGIARDGVIHVPRSVLIPPRHVNGEEEETDDEEIEVEDLKLRLDPYLEEKVYL